MRILLLILLLLTRGVRAAESPGAAGRALIAAIHAANAEAARALCHRYEVPEWSPWSIRTLMERAVREKLELVEAGEPLVFRDRAVLTLRGGAPARIMLVWLTREKGEWGLVGWRESPRLSKEWLYEPGRTGSAAKPEEAVDAYVTAIAADDREAAERQCSFRAWTASDYGFEKIFVNTRKSRAELRRIALSQRNRRAFVLLEIVVRGRLRGEFHVLCAKRGAGWLMVHATAKQTEAEEFLQNKPWPFEPKTPQELRTRFLDAVRERAYWRVRRLCTGACWGLGQIASTYLKAAQVQGASLSSRAKARVRGRRAVCDLPVPDKVLLLLIRARNGWRIDGQTTDAEHASKYLAGQARARK